MSKVVSVGILALQGDFLEHAEILKELNATPVYIKKHSDLEKVDALIIPGGESTTIGKLIEYKNLGPHIQRFVDEGKPVMGTCAGAIILAKEVRDRVVGITNQFTLKLMDISILRNAFGRQRESFETTLWIDGLGEVRAAFIRAPAILNAWNNAKIIGYVEHPAIGKAGAAAIQNNMLALTFHPEITQEKKVYSYFLNLIKK